MVDINTPWGGRFEETVSDFFKQFGDSLPVDKRLYQEDVDGSKAHAKMLAAQGIISQKDCEAILRGLDEIASEISAGSFVLDNGFEDVHMAIEAELTKRIGSAGARLHTGRSRNDQVATDMRLWVMRSSRQILAAIGTLRKVLINTAEKEFGVIMPGYTHMQKAQPILLSHHLLAYEEMLTRDCVRFESAFRSADVNVLGCAALAGTTYPLDREMTAQELGMSSVNSNSLDGVSDRDFVLDFVYACSVCQMHLSRLCEELILWSTEEFGFVKFSDKCSTGSSIMPQKKNPDFAELVRGKTGRIYGSLMSLLTIMKGLPLAYNKDLQEDKEGAFDSFDTLEASIYIVNEMMDSLTFNTENMNGGSQGGFMAATDLADYLVGKGLPFRDAHEVVGLIVLDCEKREKILQDLTREEFTHFSELFAHDVLDSVDIRKVVSKRNTYGGTGHAQVQAALDKARHRCENFMVGLQVTNGYNPLNSASHDGAL